MAGPHHPDPREPLTRLADVVVFAPIGLAAIARERLPELAAEGRQRVEQRLTVARTIGRMVVEQGRRELERRRHTLTEHPGTTTADGDGHGDRPVVRPDAPVVSSTDGTYTRGNRSDGGPGSAAADQRDIIDTIDDIDAGDLPIDDYESLAASQVVARLGDLDREGLDAVEAFERAHRNRRTVLGRVGQLRTSV